MILKDMTSRFYTVFASLIAPTLVLLFCSASIAQESAKLPSHCKANEFAYLNANMSKVHNFPKPSGGWKKGDRLYELRKTGKVLSICADSRSEPLHFVAYRFGPIGKIEMERVATVSQKFHVFERSTSPHTGQNILYFAVGSHTYCVTEATAQGTGISLTVLKHGREVLYLFSGNEAGSDFESGLIDVWFSLSRSPVLEPLVTDNGFQTPCDVKTSR
jgi:hypothetical protein